MTSRSSWIVAYFSSADSHARICRTWGVCDHCLSGSLDPGKAIQKPGVVATGFGRGVRTARAGGGGAMAGVEDADEGTEGGRGEAVSTAGATATVLAESLCVGNAAAGVAIVRSWSETPTIESAAQARRLVAIHARARRRRGIETSAA
jgi:hypothetical protein